MLHYNYWNAEEREILKESYKSYPIKYNPRLVEKHGVDGCHTEAYRMKLTKGIRNPGLDLSHLTEPEKAYMAGIIDGEGSIMMNYNKPKTNPTISVANTHKGVLVWIQGKFTAGGLTVTFRRRNNPKWADFWQLHIAGVKNVYDVLTAMQPYLIIKKDRCDKAMEFLKKKYNL